jgi:hypothetical protein
MADISDVSTALGQLIGATLYPSGASGEAASPVAGVPVRIEAGWPSPQSLDAAIAAGKVHVSIYPRPAEKNVTRYPRRWTTSALNPPTYTLAKSGQTVTVGGAAPGSYYPHNLAVFVNGAAYITQATAGQTAAQLASALQALIVADIAGTTVAGPVITFPAAARIGAVRVGTIATSQREIRRQQRDVQITVWAPSPQARDAVTAPVDVALAATDFLTLADGSRARLIYRSSPVSDFDQKQGIFRRDLIYSAEYATLQSETDTQIVVGQAAVQDPAGVTQQLKTF